MTHEDISTKMFVNVWVESEVKQSRTFMFGESPSVALELFMVLFCKWMLPETSWRYFVSVLLHTLIKTSRHPRVRGEWLPPWLHGHALSAAGIFINKCKKQNVWFICMMRERQESRDKADGYYNLNPVCVDWLSSLSIDIEACETHYLNTLPTEEPP